MKAVRGFSLIELMVAIAIVGILAAIAFPSYQNSVIKGNRANAKAFLMEVAQKEQQYLLDNRSYVAAADNAALETALKVTVPDEVERLYEVKVELVAGPPPGFTVTATPKAGSKQAPDGWLALAHTGAKTSQYAGKW